MPEINFISEAIDFEQLLKENYTDTMVKGEYLIPDTHPDVIKILMIGARPVIINSEIMQDKIYLEGQVEYNVLYFSKEEERTVLNSVTYNDKFNSQLEVGGAEHKMLCEADCDVEHINASIINERKIAVDGIFNIKCSVYENRTINLIKDMDSSENVQMQRISTSIDKVVGSLKEDIIGRSSLQVPADKPEIGKVLKISALLHKKDLRVMEGRVQCGAFCKINVIYRGAEGNEINVLEDDVYINEDFELQNALPNMLPLCDFTMFNAEYAIREDEVGEKRIIDVEVPVKALIKIVSRENIDTIKDAYSPNTSMELTRENYSLVMMLGQNTSENIVKDNIYLEPQDPTPLQVLATLGRVSIVDKKVMDNRVLLEGLIKGEVIYRTNDENNSVNIVSGDIPFNASVDIPGLKIDMFSRVRMNLESIEADIEANTLALKAVVGVNARGYYNTSRDFLVSVKCSEEQQNSKYSSITIYMVQPDDNLWEVAKKYHTTQEELIRLNDLEVDSEIKSGDKLLIPGRALL